MDNRGAAWHINSYSFPEKSGHGGCFALIYHCFRETLFSSIEGMAHSSLFADHESDI